MSLISVAVSYKSENWKDYLWCNLVIAYRCHCCNFVYKTQEEAIDCCNFNYGIDPIRHNVDSYKKTWPNYGEVYGLFIKGKYADGTL